MPTSSQSAPAPVPTPTSASAPVEPDGSLIEDLVRMARSYCLRRYSMELVQLGFQFSSASVWEPVGLRLCLVEANRPAIESPRPAPQTGYEMGTTPSRAHDWSWVYWPGAGRHHFGTPRQRDAIAYMWARLYLAGEPYLTDQEILDGSNSLSTRLIDVFRNNPAWGRLILKGPRRATRCFPPVLYQPGGEVPAANAAGTV